MRLALNSLTPFAIAISYLFVPALWLDVALIWAPVAAFIITAYFRDALRNVGHSSPGAALALLITKCFLISFPPVAAIAAGWLPAHVPIAGAGIDQRLVALADLDTTDLTDPCRILLATVLSASFTTILLIVSTSKQLQKRHQFGSSITSGTPAEAARIIGNLNAATWGLGCIPLSLFLLAPQLSTVQTGAHLALFACAMTGVPYGLVVLWATAAANLKSDGELATYTTKNKE